MQAKQSWPRNAWYLAAWNGEIGERPLARTVLNQKIALYRGADGKIAALEDRCCHRAAPLSMGRVAPTGLQCRYHGMIFAADGKCVLIPGQDTIPPQACVRSYPIVERQEFVWIWMGEAEKADPQQIVEFPPKESRVKGSRQHGMIPMKCNYMLLVDNLMDLTHIPFVHDNTLGGTAQMDLLDATVTAERTGRGVHYVRWTLGHTPPPFHVKVLGLGPDVKVDRWQDFEYVAPASVLQWAGALESGRGAQREREQPGALSLRLYHGATPETENTCFYFWMRANSMPDDPSSAETAISEMKKVLAQDVEILEAQNARMIDEAERPLVDIKNDNLRILARRTLDRMISAEH
jgi:phenylpropionate dioxygenase-like ring-hydroxylating dioxygenase large terminal subunit